MGNRKLVFPDGFLWGVASSAHQNEGNNINNDFWQWEQEPDHIADQTTSGLATDWWENAEVDFDRAAAMGLNSLRLSVEWSRIEPRAGTWDISALDRYRAMLIALHDRGLEPMVTLHHFANPLWLAEQGGWANADTVAYFERFVRKVVEALGDLTHLWCTINEPNIYSLLAHITGDWPPGKKNALDFIRVGRNQLRAHAIAAQVIHKHDSEAQVGIVKHMAAIDPLQVDQVADRLVASLQDRVLNWGFLASISHGRYQFPFGVGLGSIGASSHGNTFIGLNYYGRDRVRFNLKSPDTLFGSPVPAPPETAWPEPWTTREMYPEGIARFATQLARYDQPIYVTENGLADAEDSKRPGFIIGHLSALHRAIQQGADVRAYYHWTLVDNYEWVEGWTTRFGLVALNTETQARTPRPSMELYAQIARENAITEDVVGIYAPELLETTFAEA